MTAALTTALIKLLQGNFGNFSSIGTPTTTVPILPCGLNDFCVRLTAHTHPVVWENRDFHVRVAHPHAKIRFKRPHGKTKNRKKNKKNPNPKPPLPRRGPPPSPPRSSATDPLPAPVTGTGSIVAHRHTIDLTSIPRTHPT